ncbi:hypothetical protein D3C71_2165550 [compost metagenome]
MPVAEQAVPFLVGRRKPSLDADELSAVRIYDEQFVRGNIRPAQISHIPEVDGRQIRNFQLFIFRE